MANVSWVGGAGSWDAGSHWSAGSIPGSRDVAQFGSGAQATVSSAAGANFFTVGGVSVASGASLDIEGVLNVGTVGGGNFQGSIATSAGGTLVVDGGALIAGQYVTSASGAVLLENGGSYQWNGTGSTQSVSFGDGLNSTFQFSQDFGGTITGFKAGDFITWTGNSPVVSSSISNNQVTLTDASGAAHVLTLAGGTYNSGNVQFVGNTLVTTAPCYVAGTHILTDRGEVPVEALRPGDRVATLLGDGARAADPTPVTETEAAHCRPVRWIGRRTLDLTHPARAGDVPVRIRAGALGPGVPHRDLLVSPEHAMLLEGRLVPAKLLVNGANVTRATELRRVTYLHVELDSHDLLLAEGAASESWLDAGNRSRFGNAPVAALNPLPEPNRPWNRGACAPHLLEGPLLEALRDHIAARHAAAALPEAA